MCYKNQTTYRIFFFNSGVINRTYVSVPKMHISPRSRALYELLAANIGYTGEDVYEIMNTSSWFLTYQSSFIFKNPNSIVIFPLVIVIIKI